MTPEEMFNNNVNLAYKILSKYNSIGMQLDMMDDLKQEALIGLWKACKSFNQDLGFTFATYAYKTINNQILMLLRKNRKHLKNISINKELAEGLTFEDVLTEPKDYITEIEEKIELDKILNAINNLKKKKEIRILDSLLSGNNQHLVAEQFKTSQPQVSKAKKKAISLIQQQLKIV